MRAKPTEDNKENSCDNCHEDFRDFICDRAQEIEEETESVCPSTGEKGHAVWEFENHEQKCLDCGKVL